MWRGRVSPVHPGLVVLAACVCGTVRAGVPEVQAIRDYVRPFLLAELPKQGNSNEWDSTGYGGYIIRSRMDVTGDGRDELFLTTSLATFRGNAEWKVFAVEADGTLSPYAGTLSFHGGLTWKASEHGSTSLFSLIAPDREKQLRQIQALEDTTQPLLRYEFRFPAIIETRKEVGEEEGAKLSDEHSVDFPQIEVVLLADHLADPKTPWRAVEGWPRTQDYFAVPGDEEHIQSLSTFTPTAALALIDKTRSSHPADDIGSPVSSDRSHAKNPLDQEKAVAVRTASGWLWLLIAGGVLLFALVIGFGFVRKPKT